MGGDWSILSLLGLDSPKSKVPPAPVDVHPKTLPPGTPGEGAPPPAMPPAAPPMRPGQPPATPPAATPGETFKKLSDILNSLKK
jgi:hypothetical protein